MKKLATISMSALMIALLVGLVTMPASAQSYPPTPTTPPPTTTPPPPTTTPPPPTTTPPPRPGKPTCGVSDTSISPGDQVTVSGKHWKPGSTVTFTLRPEDINLGSTTVAQNGKFSAVVTIPDSIQPGPHTIVCSGIDRKGDPFVLALAVTILGVVGGGGAAFTGTILNVPVWLLLIAALFTAGVVAVAIGRRRRRSVGTSS
jgi:hypothetical protein